MATRASQIPGIVKIGDRLRDNDPRNDGRIVTVDKVTKRYVEFEGPNRRGRVSLDRVFIDSQSRHQGYNLLNDIF